MKIAVVGTGAMGCMLGGLLSRAGHEVWLIGRRESDVRVINERGVILCTGGEETVVRPRATTSASEVGTADLVLFLVKSFDTPVAARAAKPMFGPNTYAMTLQNGIGNVEAIMNELDMDRVIYGVTFAGGSLKGPGHVEVDALSVSQVPARIGEWRKGKSEMALKVCRALNDAGIPTEISDDPEQLLWSTVAQKSGILMVTAITRLKVGDLLAIEEGRELVSHVVGEVLQVAELRGIRGLRSLEETMDYAFSAAKKTSQEHVTSMLAAVLNKKRTEVDSLGEATAREAEQLGASAPINKTLALLIQIIQKTYGRSL